MVKRKSRVDKIAIDVKGYYFSITKISYINGFVAIFFFIVYVSKVSRWYDVRFVDYAVFCLS